MFEIAFMNEEEWYHTKAWDTSVNHLLSTELNEVLIKEVYLASKVTGSLT